MRRSYPISAAIAMLLLSVSACGTAPSLPATTDSATVPAAANVTSVPVPTATDAPTMETVTAAAATDAPAMETATAAAATDAPTMETATAPAVADATSAPMETTTASAAADATSAPMETTTDAASTAEAASTATGELAYEAFDPSTFNRSTTIDNNWLPMKPGMQYIYTGTTIDDAGASVPHRVVFTVTELTKVIEGVRNVVIWEEDFSDDVLAESELAFFAQADDGVIWHFGQYPEVYDNGEVIETPSWIAGIEEARPGITMKADPKLGEPDYSQGLGPAVGWTDRAQVDQVGVEVCVSIGCYKDVLVTKETALGEKAFQLKYYAPGVGSVQVGFRGEDETKETLELIEINTLTPEQMADVHAKVMEMEKRAFELDKEVYGQTAPIEPAPDA